MNDWWKAKKQELIDKQQAYQAATHKLKRTRITGQGILTTSYEPWPTTRDVLQRIANAMPREKRKINGLTELVQHYTPKMIMRQLNGGDKLTTRFDAVYSLVSINEK